MKKTRIFASRSKNINGCSIKNGKQIFFDFFFK